MIPELGSFFLVLALFFALFLVFSPKSAAYYVIAEGVCIGGAYICLTLCFLQDDFTVRYVLLNSSTSLPWFYKLCAVWGGHEGSMLLWVLILSAWTVAIVLFSRRLERVFYERVLLVLGALSIGFLLFLLCTSNPFLRQFEVLNSTGRDLNPLLQDPGFLFHPPMLYMGYVGFSVAFALAIAALWLGRVESAWASWVRPWTLAAWCCLTAGITLGSWWAYRELGWGGWWFWDPVENASFMPWLAGTALLHSLVVNEKRAHLKAWTVLLAITAFSLSLIGTFLVRSGVLTSVHAFAVDPARGLYILLFLLVVVGGSLGLFAVRVDALKQKDKPFLVSREGGLLLNNVFLSVSMLTVLLGTVYPLFIDALGLGKLSVGAPYFNAVFVPLMLPVLALMGFGVNLRFKQDDWRKLGLSLKYAFLLSMISPILIFLWLKQPVQPLVFLGLALGFWVIFATLKSLKIRLKSYQLTQVGLRFWGMFFAHIGVAVVVLGISLSTGFGLEQDIKLSPNEVMDWAGFKVKLHDVSDLKGPNYEGTRACFKLSKTDWDTQICPEKRIYDVSHMVMSDAGIHAGFFRDIYIALGEPLPHGAWSLRLMYKPGVRWIWGGGFLILFGGFLALLSGPLLRKTK
ncbi:MAG: heme lyase CcmF/NrfE family subunit [Gammaproteobacteria bacterium]|nr:heme lyase CcmF/NrfE family subunit [Gammaproteobacteria bacterium]